LVTQSFPQEKNNQKIFAKHIGMEAVPNSHSSHVLSLRLDLRGWGLGHKLP